MNFNIVMQYHGIKIANIFIVILPLTAPNFLRFTNPWDGAQGMYLFLMPRACSGNELIVYTSYCQLSVVHLTYCTLFHSLDLKSHAHYLFTDLLYIKSAITIQILVVQIRLDGFAPFLGVRVHHFSWNPNQEFTSLIQ